MRMVSSEAACIMAAMVLAVGTRHTHGQECIGEGERLLDRREYKKAIMALQKCEEQAGAAALLGKAYYGMNYFEEAKTYLKDALEESPGNLELKIMHGGALARNKEFKKAVAEFEKLAAEHPDNIEIKREHARALGWNKQYDKAIALYEKMREENPEDYASWVQIGVLTSWDKHFKEAEEIFASIIAADPPPRWKVQARLHLAEVLGWHKKFDKAIAQFDKVLAEDATRVEAYLGKGEVLEWQGAYREAKKQYEKALSVDPGNRNAKARLEQLMWVK